MISNPGRYFWSSNAGRRFYKTAVGCLLLPRTLARERLRSLLPEAPRGLHIDPRLGYRIVQPSEAHATWPALEPALRACERVIECGAASVTHTKSYLRRVLDDQACSEVPQLWCGPFPDSRTAQAAEAGIRLSGR